MAKKRISTHTKWLLKMFGWLANQLNRRGAMAVLVLVLIGVALFYLGQHTERLKAFDWRLEWTWMSLAVLVAIGVDPLARVTSWYWVLRGLGGQVAWLDCFRIRRLSDLAKYIPGQGWQYLSLMYMTHTAGMSKVGSLVSLLYDWGLIFLGFTLAFAVAYLIEPFGSLISGMGFVILSASVIGCMALQPRLFGKTINIGLQFVGRELMHKPPTLKTAQLAPLLAFNTIEAIVQASVLYALVLAVTSVNVPFWPCLAIAIVSLLSSFVAFFAPGGIVVREAMMVSLLQLYLPFEVCVVISVLFRVLTSTKEVVLGIVALFIKRDAHVRPISSVQ